MKFCIKKLLVNLCTIDAILYLKYQAILYQKKELILDKGDRLITIANFNNLETVNHSQWLHIL